MLYCMIDTVIYSISIIVLHCIVYYVVLLYTECVIPDVLNNRTHVKSTQGRVLLYPEINPPATYASSYIENILCQHYMSPFN